MSLHSLYHDYNKMDFYMTNKLGGKIRAVFCRNKKFTYYSSNKKYFKPKTYLELFNLLKPYVEKYIKEYKNFKIFKKPITNTVFRLIILPETEPKLKDFFNGVILYETEIDNQKDEIKYEYENTKLFSTEEKIISFEARIEVELYDENNFFQYDGEKDYRIEDLCIKCKRNKPNVLITKCFHMVICSHCLHYDNSFKCPYCQKPFASLHKICFSVSSRN